MDYCAVSRNKKSHDRTYPTKLIGQKPRMYVSFYYHERISGKMKIDTTSAHLILSRKIRLHLNPLFSLILLGFMLVWPAYTWAEMKLLVTPKHLNSIPQGELIIVDSRSKLKYLLGIITI